LIVLII